MNWAGRLDVTHFSKEHVYIIVIVVVVVVFVVQHVPFVNRMLSIYQTYTSWYLFYSMLMAISMLSVYVYVRKVHSV